MHPISLIERALAVGAALGVDGSASSDQRDAYAQLKGMVRYRFADRPKAEEILADHEEDPETYQAPLRKMLRQVGADEDHDLVFAAEVFLALVDSAGARWGMRVTGIVADRGGVAAAHIEGDISARYKKEAGVEAVDSGGGGGGSPAGGTTDD